MLYGLVQSIYFIHGTVYGRRVWQTNGETDILITNAVRHCSVWLIKRKLQNKPRRWLNGASRCARKERSSKTRRSRLWTVSSRQHLTRYQTLRYHFYRENTLKLTDTVMYVTSMSCTQSMSNVVKHQTQHFDKCIPLLVERQTFVPNTPTLLHLLK